MKQRRVRNAARIAPWAAALAALPGCSAGTSKPTVDAAGEGGTPNPCGAPVLGWRDRNAAELFATPTIPVFDLYLPAADWEALKAHAREEIYVPAQACFEGQALGQVGLRFKGSYGSLYNCFDAAGQNTCRKLGMKIKFDEYVDGQHFFGLKRLNFQAYRYNDSYLKERLAYNLYRAMDIVAPRAAWAKLRVNGEAQGLFGMVEQIDGRFTQDRWPANGDGNVFKERWPGTTDAAWLAAGLETNQAAADVGAFAAFGTALNAAAEPELGATLGRFTDLDYFARYMAVDDAIANFDGITTYYTSGSPDEAGNHNFYFYQESAQRFTLIPWDLEATLSLLSNFGNVPSWQLTPADCTTTYLVWGGPLRVIAPGCDRIFRALAANRTAYRAAVRRLLDGPFAEAAVQARIDTLAAFLRPEATSNPHGPGAVGFENGVSFLRKGIGDLRRRLEFLLTGQPIVPLVLGVGAVNDFEAADAYGITAGTTWLSNPNSTAGVALNDTDAIAGQKSVRIVFNLGDEAKAWQQWMFYRIPFASPPVDLNQLRGLRVKVRSDELRPLRIDVDSPNNSATNDGVQVGWDAAADTTTKTVSVLFADARVPEWADDPKDSLAAILQTATGLTFRPKCNHVESTGHLPAGVTDNGWVDIDDIEFF